MKNGFRHCCYVGKYWNENKNGWGLQQFLHKIVISIMYSQTQRLFLFVYFLKKVK